MTHPNLFRTSLALLGAGAMSAALASPAAAQESVSEEDSGEILQVAYPDGPLVLSGLVPGGDNAGRAVVTNTSEQEFEVLVTSDWPETSTAEAGVNLLAEICAGARLEDECTVPAQQIDLGTDPCATDVIGAGESWDVRFTAVLPEGTGDEAQGLSSSFAVDFAMAAEVYEEITGDTAEPAVNDCPAPDEDLLPDDGPTESPAPTTEPTEQPAEPPVPTAEPTEEAAPADTPLPTVEATEESTQQPAGPPIGDEDVAEAQEHTDEGLATTGFNGWMALLMSLGLVVIGSMLLKRRRAQGAGS